MNLRIASDLHLEFLTKRGETSIVQSFESALPPHEKDTESILLLAGDLYAGQLRDLFFLLEHVSRRFKHVVYVPGNHEYYGQHYGAWNKSFMSWLGVGKPDNFHSCAGGVGVWEHENTAFVFGTLWGAGGDPLSEMRIKSMIADFRFIKMFNTTFSVEDMRNINSEQSKAIRSACLPLSRAGKKIVVVTHHLPFRELCHQRFDASLNGAFASNELDFLQFSDFAPDLWVCGHTHDTIDTTVYNTRIIANPAGYPGEFAATESNQFNKYDKFKFIAF